MTTAKIFGGNLTAGQQNIAELGSTAGGGINYSLDLNVLQNTSWLEALTTADRIQSPAPANVPNYSPTQPYVANDYAKDPATNTVYISLRGDITTPNLGNPFTDATWWKVVGNKFFVFQEVINSVAFTLSTLIAEIQKAGLQDWLSTTTYYQYAVVKEPNTTKIYYSKIANNIGNALNDTNSWEYINDFTNLKDLNLKYAALLSPAFQGTPTAPTPALGDNSQKIATTSWVNIYAPKLITYVFATSNQNFTSNADTKVNFTSKLIDNNNQFNTTTMQFKPTFAGWYNCYFNLLVRGNGPAYRTTAFFVKNGAGAGRDQSSYCQTHDEVVQVSQLHYFNGTTDFLEVFVNRDNNVTAPFVYAGSYFQAQFIQY